MTRQLIFPALFICLCATTAFSQPPKSSDIAALCNRIAEIKELPMKGGPGVDAVYDSIIAAGEMIVPCLIKQVTNTTPMRDPRCPPFSDRTTVGDVAYFLLTDITKLDFVELLPASIQEKYKTEGAYAYETYVRRKGARRQLQLRLSAWYRQKYASASAKQPSSCGRHTSVSPALSNLFRDGSVG